MVWQGIDRAQAPTGNVKRAVIQNMSTATDDLGTDDLKPVKFAW